MYWRIINILKDSIVYAYYEPQLYNITFSGSHVSFSTNPLKVPYTLASQITLTPTSGYYFESISCSTGYTVSGFASGTAHYSAQTITITNNTHVGGGTCTIKMHARSYPAHSSSRPCNCHKTCESYCCETASTGCHNCCTKYCTDYSKCSESCDTCTDYSCPNGGTLSGTTCVFS